MSPTMQLNLTTEFFFKAATFVNGFWIQTKIETSKTKAGKGVNWITRVKLLILIWSGERNWALSHFSGDCWWKNKVKSVEKYSSFLSFFHRIKEERIPFISDYSQKLILFQKVGIRRVLKKEKWKWRLNFNMNLRWMGKNSRNWEKWIKGSFW